MPLDSRDLGTVERADAEVAGMTNSQEPARHMSARESYAATLDEELDTDLTGQSKVWIAALGCEVWGTEADLDENAYGAAAVALIKDITKLHYQIYNDVPWEGISLTIVRLCTAMGIMLVNLIFQATILYYIYTFVVEPSVKNVQVMYAEFRAGIFDEHGKVDDEAWANYPGKSAVCQITMSNLNFYFGILVLWSLLMMDELRKCERVARDIAAIRHVDKLEDQLCYSHRNGYDVDGVCLVVGLTTFMRWTVLLTVCVPRAIIGFVLLFLGYQWLASSGSFADMTLNAMALEFVKNIDEILYDAVLPRQLKQDIADTNVFKIEQRKTKKDLDASEWKAYKRTCLWVGFMIGGLVTFSVVVQTVLPFDLTELNALCTVQRTESQTPICTHMTFSGWSEDCYPYGSHYYADGSHEEEV
mmetsp:Transcript_165551/g.531287  ORF Transcript_165551/g.531287 Transcript_165551/m.531287 type:complete len:416 (-) Transcript_165551:244-1491(-)|eukprot:CAMPEP_0203962426 /NCGR_PEP_ID=MMETSP0359-20131031/92623_1 /ASSEMBLY_ACC=CAM_ASM_000338 /TAXON_ID=268821 /ORGANISM="Scrippsiella Hangoei, Strain SHTV-5" /LENGTH=415 /DNA_ID=CAMNT_0050897745 /DNA_START=75 /DNA_END=1322 /DNA_ORIENTATION=+